MEHSSRDSRGCQTIGQVAAQVGLSPDTLRTWERRYGWPVPERTDSGHRRYGPEVLGLLKKIVTLLGQGHRPAELVPLAVRGLEGIAEPGEDRPPICAELLEAVHAFEERVLLDRLEAAFRLRSPIEFISEVVAPFMNAVGVDWAEGRLSVEQEHFASHTVSSFLQAQRSQTLASEDLPGPRMICACLPGDDHELGALSVAFCASSLGLKATLLGANTPLEGIVQAASKTGASSVGISVSIYRQGRDARSHIKTLRDLLDPEVKLFVGGQGARGSSRTLPGVTYLESVEALRELMP